MHVKLFIAEINVRYACTELEIVRNVFETNGMPYRLTSITYILDNMITYIYLNVHTYIYIHNLCTIGENI